MVYIEKDFPIESIDRIAWSESNARKPIYHIHKWFARRVGSTFRAIILGSFLEENPMDYYYDQIKVKSKEGKPPIIIDPFMGGGTTIIEGHRLGCKMIGVDVNPLAWYITKMELTPSSVKNVNEEYKRIQEEIKVKITSYYRTTCNEGHDSDVMYVFWIKMVDCENCKKEIQLLKSLILAKLNPSEWVYLCPSCGNVFWSEGDRSKVTCSSCNSVFNPNSAIAKKRTYTCPLCTYDGDILKAVQQKNNPPPLQMIAIEYYCQICGRDYKKPDENDEDLYFRSQRELEGVKSEWLGKFIPKQSIPNGYNTRQMINFNYNFWYEMFNERQLFCLSLLLKEILSIENERTRMFFLITFSDCLNANNLFTLYNTGARKLEPLFGGHHFWPPISPIEGNVWGTKYGRGTFQAYFRKGLKALQYQQIPYEFRYKHRRTKKGELKEVKIKENFPQEFLRGIFAQSFQELLTEKNVLLKCGTAENLSFVPDRGVDAVITDPPYYDNIMYSELSDFFYVWLRLGLKDQFPEIFGSSLTRKEREILVNQAQRKDEDFYIEGMTRVFKEAHRVLKDDGLMTFVFQHKKTAAWAAVLKALLESNFYVVAVYPTHGETPSGLRKFGINYNSVLVCKKRLEESQKRLPWIIFESELRGKIDKEIDRILDIHPGLEVEDAFTIAMGKALEVYSQNYGLIYKNSKVFDVSELSMELMGEIVFDSLQRHVLERVPDVDRFSKIFAGVFATKEKITIDTINKLTRHGGLDTDLFEEEKVVKRDKKKGIMMILTPEERKSHIMKKIEKGVPLTYIDAAHLLWAAREGEEDFRETMELILLSGLDGEKVGYYIRFLGERSGNVMWKKILHSYQNEPLKTLDKFFENEGQ